MTSSLLPLPVRGKNTTDAWRGAFAPLWLTAAIAGPKYLVLLYGGSLQQADTPLTKEATMPSSWQAEGPLIIGEPRDRAPPRQANRHSIGRGVRTSTPMSAR